MADTVKVRFVRDYQVKDAEGKVYEEGKTYPMPEASAQHFVRRRVAVIDGGKAQGAGAKKKGNTDEPGAGDAAGG